MTLSSCQTLVRGGASEPCCLAPSSGCSGRSALHIGASGLIYALMGFLIAAGLLERRLISALVALSVGIIYGASIIGAHPARPRPMFPGKATSSA